MSCTSLSASSRRRVDTDSRYATATVAATPTRRRTQGNTADHAPDRCLFARTTSRRLPGAVADPGWLFRWATGNVVVRVETRTTARVPVTGRVRVLAKTRSAGRSAPRYTAASMPEKGRPGMFPRLTTGL